VTGWTPEKRIEIAVHLLGIVQLDIPAGRYSVPGRPNVSSVVSVLTASAELLDLYRGSLVEVLSAVVPDARDIVPRRST